MNKSFLWPAGLLIGSLFACQTPSPSHQLAKTVLADSTLQIVDSMARNVLAQGFNAGSGYSQVWARDL